MQKDSEMQTLRKKSWYENAFMFNMQINRIMFSYIFEMRKLQRSICVE
jgi:hypothetical protein